MEVASPQIVESTTLKAIENGFPVAFISRLAEHESWRKEVYRPIYYLHKWWARRLGSVFRAIIIAACERKDENIQRLFYEPREYPDITIFDPFMGSGTTVGEAVKLGLRVIGRDINPIPLTMTSAALQRYDKKTILDTFTLLAESVGPKIRSYYSTCLPNGEQADVLTDQKG